MGKILLIDNYDSFTYNVYQYLLELHYNVISIRNDQITIEKIENEKYDAIVISPGPGEPKEAGICIDVVKRFKGEIPIFGICLGHQIIGEAFGGNIVHAKELFHGKTSVMHSLKKGVFEDFEDTFIATRYHSLIVEKETLPDCFEITCETKDGEIMGIKHKTYEIEGVQFHPESIMTQNGMKMLENFLVRAKVSKRSDPVINPNHYEKLSIKESLGIKQYAKQVHTDKDFFEIFKALRDKFGAEQCCIFDSVSGADIDCNNSYIGLFPMMELIIDNKTMKINSASELIRDTVRNNFSDLYDKGTDSYLLGNKCFSDIFPIFAAAFKAEKCHNFNPNYSNGLIGVFSYEYLHYVENVPRIVNKALNFPDVHLKYFETVIEYNPYTKSLLVINNRFKDDSTPDLDIDGIYVEYSKKAKTEVKNSEIMDISSNIGEKRYFEMVAKAKQHIVDGDIFQIQLGRRLHIKQDIDSLHTYERLRAINPSPYMFLWENSDYQLLSNSPELQLKVENGKVIIRPIAGTSKGKGNSHEEALALRKALEDDPKEQAEHIMLVDLARNDIGRVAMEGSVTVSSLMKSEEFSHVYHLISSVEGKLDENTNTMKLFESTFPAGTLTGAPKVRAMEIINSLETEERGPYGGAFGFFDFNGNIISSIIIRTILKKKNDLYLHASAGIVADSKDYLEWQEIGHKTEAIKKILVKED